MPAYDAVVAATKNVDLSAVNNKPNKSIDYNINSGSSKFKLHREYLMSPKVAWELNTYISFDPFATFNDLYALELVNENGDYKEITNVNPDTLTPDQKQRLKKYGSGTPGVRSLFNKSSAVIVGGNDSEAETVLKREKSKYIIMEQASEWRISNNVPLIDNRKSRKAIKESSGCTIKELVEASESGMLGKNIYSYADFMYCKHLGKMSNNYLITLRRFPYPVDDFISSIGVGKNRRKKHNSSSNASSIGCMVTWMGTPGNNVTDILKYSISMPFQEKSAQLMESQKDADSGPQGPLNAIAAAFDSSYRKQYQAGQAGTLVNRYLKGVAGMPLGDPPYPARDWNSFRDQNKAYGPIDRPKITHIRGEDGLKFDQNFTLTFDYELRSYNGINGRQAMLDLLTNILNVTYNTGSFWGGGYRGGGAHQNNIFANLNIFKTSGGFSNFVNAFAKDAANVGEAARNYVRTNYGEINSISDFFKVAKQVLNNLGGMLISGVLNTLGRPQKIQAASILTPAPVGLWHVTIGNPHHPIMSVGNMILSNTTIQHYGPLGLDDFPTGLKVTCELKRGKSRDIRDIEKLYMHGNDRIYSPMGPKIFDMYKSAKIYADQYTSSSAYRKAYHKSQGNDSASWDEAGEEEIGGVGVDNIDDNKNQILSDEDYLRYKNIMGKYFGTTDTNSIRVASMEQEWGSARPTTPPDSETVNTNK